MITKKAKILVACEESQAVVKWFRALGFEAYSCDLLPCSGGHPEWHFNCDVFEIIKNGGGTLQNGEQAFVEKFDLMIGHPPCTFLSVSGARWMYKKDGSIDEERYKNQQEGLNFVRGLMNADIKHIAIENPVSVISTQIRKPDQIIQPWQFGDKAQKTTCLWNKNLPDLEHTNIVEKGEFIEFMSAKGVMKKQPKWYFDALKNAKTTAERRTLRSKTFKGIAEAIAKQWGDFVEKTLN